MANGHSPNKPPNQGSFGGVSTSKPKYHEQNDNKQGPAAPSTVKKGIRVPGVGGSRKP